MQPTYQSKNASSSNVHSLKPFFKKEGESELQPEHSESKQPFFSSEFLQPKLAYGQPGDAYEQEADVMAEKVVENNDSFVNSPTIHPKVDESEQNENVQVEDEKDLSQKSAVGAGGDNALSMSENKPIPSVLPKSKVSKSSVTNSIKANGEQELRKSTPITTYIAKKETATSENEKGGNEQKEENIFVDEIGGTEESEISNDNSISPTFTHLPTVTRGGAGPRGFGITRSSIRFTNVNISSSIGTLVNNGIYTVTANLEHTIRWQVRTGTGPRGQVDIAGDTDNDIKACNYQLISKDLTPNMSSDNGRPPRSKYWAEDLTTRHELFHAENQFRDDFGPQATTDAQTWLSAQTASSASQIETLLMPRAYAVARLTKKRLSNQPSTEGDTYGDGAPLYQARADSIKTKGDAGDYGFVTTDVKVLPKGGGTHTVVQGDTLWHIAEQTYGNPRLWRRIHEANPGKARDGGNLIFPGQNFDLPEINVDQQLFVILTLGNKSITTPIATVPGGGSHMFFNLPNELFEDTTNCAGDVTVEVWDGTDPTGSGVFFNRLLNSIWSIPANATIRNGNIEVDVSLEP